MKREDINRQKNNPRLLARLARKKEKFSTIKAKRDAERANISYERVKSHQYSIEESDSWREHLRKKAERKNPEYAGNNNDAFIHILDYGDLAKRKYDRLVAGLKPDFSLYKQRLHTDPIDPFTSFTPTRENVSKMVEDVYEQIEKRTVFSKKKRFDPDADVTYINERNRRFNEKISRTYGAITQELRESVEQGPYLGRINQKPPYSRDNVEE